MKFDIVNDIKMFYKKIGGLDELSERDVVDLVDINTEEHKKYLEKLIKKYNIEFKYNHDLNDDILSMEEVIDEKFTKIMESV